MTFVVSLWDIGIWLAFSSIIILITTEMFSPHYGRINLRIDIKKLRNISIASGVAFIFIAVLNIASLLITR